MKYIFAFLLALLPLTAVAEIEKNAIPSDKGMTLYWWPKVAAPKGWHQDLEQSYAYRFNALAPDGYSFADAKTVIYAKAEYKRSIPKVKSLEQLITDDQKDFLSTSPNMKIEEVLPLTTADGKSWRSFTFKPKDEGNWERVAYGEEGEFYLIFTVSSRTLEGLHSSEKTYEELIQSYKE